MTVPLFAPVRRRTPPEVGLNAMSSPIGHFSEKYLRPSSRRMRFYACIETYRAALDKASCNDEK
jgi:hypothetical protein